MLASVISNGNLTLKTISAVTLAADGCSSGSRPSAPSVLMLTGVPWTHGLVSGRGKVRLDRVGAVGPAAVAIPIADAQSGVLLTRQGVWFPVGEVDGVLPVPAGVVVIWRVSTGQAVGIGYGVRILIGPGLPRAIESIAHPQVHVHRVSGHRRPVSLNGAQLLVPLANQVGMSAAEQEARAGPTFSDRGGHEGLVGGDLGRRGDLGRVRSVEARTWSSWCQARCHCPS